MKKIILMFVLVLLLLPMSVYASDAGFSSEAYLAANPDVKAAGIGAYEHIAMISGDELKSRLAATSALTAKANSGREIKIMFSDVFVLSEYSEIQPMLDWKQSTGANITTIIEMTKAGWIMQNIFSINAKQFFVVFAR